MATSKKAAKRKKVFNWTPKDLDMILLPISDTATKYGMTKQQVHSRRNTIVQQFGKSYPNATASAQNFISSNSSNGGTQEPIFNDGNQGSVSNTKRPYTKRGTNGNSNQPSPDRRPGLHPTSGNGNEEITYRGVKIGFPTGTKVNFSSEGLVFDMPGRG